MSEEIIKVNLGNTKGVKRKIDELNRIVIPMEFIEDLKIEKREKLEIYQINNNGIFIRKEK